MAARTSRHLRFFSTLLRKTGSWQGDFYHDPYLGNAPRRQIAITPISQTARPRRPQHTSSTKYS